MECKHVVLVNYPDSYWGTDIVEFTFTIPVHENFLEARIEEAMEVVQQEDYDSLQGYADAVFNMVLSYVDGNGKWRYVKQSCTINIMND